MPVSHYFVCADHLSIPPLLLPLRRLNGNAISSLPVGIFQGLAVLTLLFVVCARVSVVIWSQGLGWQHAADGALWSFQRTAKADDFVLALPCHDVRRNRSRYLVAETWTPHRRTVWSLEA